MRAAGRVRRLGCKRRASRLWLALSILAATGAGAAESRSADGMAPAETAPAEIAPTVIAPTVIASAAGAPDSAPGHPGDERDLVAAITDLHGGRLDEALSRMEALVARNPNFRLAHLVYADLLLAKSRPLSGPGGGAQSDAHLDDLIDEARARLGYHREPPAPGTLPEQLLRLSLSQGRVVVVDVSASRLYVFDNVEGLPVVAESFYVSTGKNGPNKHEEGDQRTPLGVYFVVTRLSAATLPDLYGAGAFPVNYPNEWDRRLGRTGFGIWIHGVPSDTYSRPPRASDGCMAMPNDDLVSIWDRLPVGTTPVVIAERLRWLDRAAVEARARDIDAAIERWRTDWESMDLQRYARNYSRDFRTGSGTDHDDWMRSKRAVNARKRWIRVGLSDVSVLGYPGEPDLVVVSFLQDYRSSNFSNALDKRQYWRLEADGQWRIVYEGSATIRPEDFRGIPYSARATSARAD